MKLAFASLALLLLSSSVFAQENLLTDSGFENAIPGAWSRDVGAVQATRDTTEKHSGTASLKVVHSGEKDWSVSPAKRINVAAGDIFHLGVWTKTQEFALAQMCVITRDKQGEVLDWSFGELKTGGTHDWQFLSRKLVIPNNCASIEPRLIGTGKGTVWFDDWSVQKTGNVADFRGGLATSPLRLQNQFLSVEISPQNGALKVTDKRNGKVWQQDFSDESLIVKSAKAQGQKATVELWDVANDLQLTTVFSLTNTPEIICTINSAGAQQNAVAYPPPFVTGKDTSLVVPLNEGIVYPVDDKDVHPMQLVGYGGHGICMAWWGIFDDKTGSGAMTILRTPDDAVLDITRKENLFGRPLWQPQKGEFGYERKITFSFFDKGGYVAQAKHYREYAKQSGLFKTLAQKRNANPSVDLLIGAANIWNWDMKPVEICAEMKKLGMERILWSRGGNGDEIKQINDLGYLTSVYDIYSDVWEPRPEAPKWLRSEGWPDDLVWERSGEWSKGWAHHQKNADGTITIFPGGVVSSSAWLKRAQTRIPNDLKDKPYRARFIDTVTASPWKEDWNPAHPQTRTQDKINKMKLLDYVQNDLKLVTGAETGIDASVPYLCYYEGMLSLGPYRLPDAGRDMIQYKPPTPEFLKFQIGTGYRVPLWELVYHDCTVAQWYWGDYNNKAPEVWPQRDLWNILYATPPMYMFDKKNWDANKTKFANSYAQIAPIARRFGYDEMLSHEWLTTDRNVQKTTWKSGAQIIVNFGNKPYKTGHSEVKALNWQLIEPKQ